MRNVATRRSSGPRVMLRPLERARPRRVARDPHPQPRLARAWEPLPEPGSPDPVVDRDAFRARCGAWERQRQFDTAYGFGIVPARRHPRRRGEPRKRAARARSSRASSATGSTSGTPGCGYMPEAVAHRDALRLRGRSASTAWRRRSCRATRRAGASRRSSACATRGPPPGSCRSAACGRTTCATRSPARSGTSAAQEFEAKFFS